jgi:hypothetical protein
VSRSVRTPAQLRGDSGDDASERGGAGNDDGLGVERGEDLGGHRLGQPWGSGPHDLGDAVLAEVAQRLRGRRSDDQVEHPAALQTGPDQAFQGGVDVQQGVAEPVGQPSGLGCEVVVVTGEHGELGEGVIVGADPAKRVGHGAGGVSDDVGVAGVFSELEDDL